MSSTPSRNVPPRGDHDADLDHSLLGGAGGHRRRDHCDLEESARTESRNAAVAQAEKKGMLWIAGAFVLCPCHLPLTLGVAAWVLGGTALGAVLRAHPFVAGGIVTVTWMAATWYGFRVLRSACTIDVPRDH